MVSCTDGDNLQMEQSRITKPTHFTVCCSQDERLPFLGRTSQKEQKRQKKNPTLTCGEKAGSCSVLFTLHRGGVKSKDSLFYTILQSQFAMLY